MKQELTKDHLTPRCIGKALGWSREQINHSDNIQMLSWQEHAKKDATTPWELQAVQRNGGAKTLWEHHNELLINKRGIPNVDNTQGNSAAKARGESVRRIWAGETIKFVYHEFSNREPVDEIMAISGAIGQQDLGLFVEPIIHVWKPQIQEVI